MIGTLIVSVPEKSCPLDLSATLCVCHERAVLRQDRISPEPIALLLELHTIEHCFVTAWKESL